jgi:hypothetical protein
MNRTFVVEKRYELVQDVPARRSAKKMNIKIPRKRKINVVFKRVESVFEKEILSMLY